MSQRAGFEGLYPHRTSCSVSVLPSLLPLPSYLPQDDGLHSSGTIGKINPVITYLFLVWMAILLCYLVSHFQHVLQCNFVPLSEL